MILRREQPEDSAVIYALTQVAFAHHTFGTHNEHRIVDALRAANALTLSLVAEDENTIVGHVAFSPVVISDGTTGWLGLGPISVVPEHQKQGIGTALIRESLTRLQAQNAGGVVLLGDSAYYGRFGFAVRPGLMLEGVPAEHFLALSFTENYPQGMVAFHPAFDTP